MCKPRQIPQVEMICWGCELITVLAERYGVNARQSLLDKLELSIAPEV